MTAKKAAAVATFKLAAQKFDPRIPIDKLREHPKNANRGSDSAVGESLDAHGFYGAVIVQKRTHKETGRRSGEFHYIIAGATRYRAAVAKGAKTIPGFWLDVDDVKAAAIRVVDNRSAALAEQDDALMLEVLSEIRETQGDLAGTGYDPDSMNDVLERVKALEPASGPEETEPIPEPPKKAKSRKGVVYELGEHRVMCGDSTDPRDIAKLLGDDKPVLAFTSPPYAVGLDYDGYVDDIKNLRPLIKALAEKWRDALAVGALMVVNFGDCYRGEAILDLEEDCEYPMAVEYIWTWRRPGQKHLNERRDPSFRGVWASEGGEGVSAGAKWDTHPAGFPVVIPEFAIKVYSNAGEVVCDPFAGSGTTLIAAEKTGRRALVMELNPSYVDVIRERFANYTKQPHLAP